MSFVGFVYSLRVSLVSRGLGSCESWIITVLGVDRHGAEVRVPDLVAGWAHWRLAAAGRSDVAEACNCPGRCVLAARSQEVAVQRAVRRLEAKGIVTARFDAWGRKVVRLSGVPVTWRPGRGVDDADAAPVLCARCGAQVAGRVIDRQRRRAALPRERRTKQVNSAGRVHRNVGDQLRASTGPALDFYLGCRVSQFVLGRGSGMRISVPACHRYRCPDGHAITLLARVPPGADSAT